MPLSPAQVLRLLREARTRQQQEFANSTNDPRFGLEAANLQGRLQVDEADYIAQENSLRGRYQQLLRQTQRELPEQLTQATESAAGRGMLYSGGRLEQLGRIRQENAEEVANTSQSMTTDLNDLLRGITSRREETQRGIGSAQQEAAARALERARANPGQDLSGRAAMIGGGYYDTTTGRPAYYGPNNQPGYARASEAGAGAQAYTMPDGRIAYYGGRRRPVPRPTAPVARRPRRLP